MKILHFITSMKIGGAESALRNFLAHVSSEVDQHFVAYLHPGPNVDAIKKLGIPVFKISGSILTYSPLVFFRLARLIYKLKPNLIHSSLWSANIIARIASKVFKIPLICDLHGDSKHEGKLRNSLDRFTAAIPSKIVAVSESVRYSYLTNINTDFNKTIVIRNGIDFEKLRTAAQSHKLTRTEFGIGNNDFVVGSVGRLDAIKSYDVLIKSFEKFLHASDKKVMGNVKLLLVGWGEQGPALQNLALNLGLENNVIFTEFRTDSYSFYPLFDCFVLASKSEGLSIALLEAMAFGLPVISTHKSKTHDVIEDGINGFLTTPNNIDELSHKLQIMQTDIELRKRMSRANINLVKEKFSMDAVAAGYNKIYSEIVKQAHSK